jgi:two-component system, chemotaxis family, chemotaxis protein CheY
MDGDGRRQGPVLSVGASADAHSGGEMMAQRKILVIEDSSIMRQLLVMALRRLPAVTVLEANDGLEALKLLANETVDLIFTDINMPQLDGLKLVALLRQDSRYGQVPIVIVTTEGVDQDRDRALQLGANAYIHKPVQTPQVVEIAARLLDRPAAQTEPLPSNPAKG